MQRTRVRECSRRILFILVSINLVSIDFDAILLMRFVLILGQKLDCEELHVPFVRKEVILKDFKSIRIGAISR